MTSRRMHPTHGYGCVLQNTQGIFASQRTNVRVFQAGLLQAHVAL